MNNAKPFKITSKPIILSGAKNLIESKATIVIEFWPYALKRSGLWEQMIEIIKKFDYFVDLSNQNLVSQKINEKTILALIDGWENEEKGQYSLHTDLILLKE